MGEFEPIRIVILLACFAVAVAIVSFWRHLAYILFQCPSVVIACGGLLLPILAGIGQDIAWVQAILVPVGFLDSWIPCRVQPEGFSGQCSFSPASR
jgi:hypothetical protein